ncbi:hypothetical protein BSQ39_07380 [Loigolactobacillus backii]|uniref:Uncharacterized protein n=1 Tax=Loigolactobacillus backii TaxID=375175 RepID=A0A192H4Q9_9LACO|nr:hypothetical protein AYR53_09420 [Loigolactobacillus backii]ANK70031.1 hypothetical protein AYR56_07585 [Loigolactobacillus backii]PIO83388.1 hypothetical protein BSQ39_07380 [Loigolactobacillus backii]
MIFPLKAMWLFENYSKIIIMMVKWIKPIKPIKPYFVLLWFKKDKTCILKKNMSSNERKTPFPTVFATFVVQF